MFTITYGSTLLCHAVDFAEAHKALVTHRVYESGPKATRMLVIAAELGSNRDTIYPSEHVYARQLSIEYADIEG